MSRAVRLVVLALIAALAGGVAAFALVKRMRTGQWSLPDGDDLVRIKRVLSGPAPAPRIIYLHRGPLELSGGADDAARDRSSIVAAHGQARVKLPGYSGSTKSWRALVACVKDRFAPFAVEVTDVRPPGRGYVMVVVGGRARDAGIDANVGGLAPFIPGQVIPDAVVFAFSRTLGNRTREICETIAMEVAHAYGLDHGYLCKDLMTYLRGCGAKKFVDKDVPCGEKKARACADGQPTQNSYRRLLGVLGARTPSASRAGSSPAPR